MRAGRGAWLALGATAALALAGCGVSTSNVPAERGTELASAARSRSLALPPRPSYTVLAEAGTPEALAPLVAKPFEAASADRVRLSRATKTRAVEDLCSGSVDVIEPGGTVAGDEAEACRRNHLDLIGPLPVAADAVVLATKNEADVGGDCLTTRQAADVFRSGSPYTSWSQLGFFDLPLRATGSLSEPVLDDLFARLVLGEAGPLSLASLRAGFVAAPEAEAVRRRIVAGDPGARDRHGRRPPGVVGFVRFSYYEQWEEQLRPLEIWAEGQGTSRSEPDCVFPSQQTVGSGHYPFAVQLVAYTTAQALARAPVRDYLVYLLTDGQALAAEAGLVPTTVPQRDADLMTIGVQPPAPEQPSTPAPAVAGGAQGAEAPGQAPPPPVAESTVPGVGAEAAPGSAGAAYGAAGASP